LHRREDLLGWAADEPAARRAAGGRAGRRGARGGASRTRGRSVRRGGPTRAPPAGAGALAGEARGRRSTGAAGRPAALAESGALGARGEEQQRDDRLHRARMMVRHELAPCARLWIACRSRSILAFVTKAVGIDLGTTHTVVAWADLAGKGA